MSADPHTNRHPREILLEAINDPKCSARDKASIANAISRFDEVPPPEGISVPFDPNFASAAVIFFSGPIPESVNPNEGFVVHRTSFTPEGLPTENSIVLFPLPPDVEEL